MTAVFGTSAITPPDAAYPGEGEIWLQRLDPQTWQLVGERHFLWRGALKRAIWAEGPHLYKQDGRYYLLVAEGGTRLTTQSPLQSATSLRGPTRVMSAIRFSPRATLAMTTGLTAPDTLTSSNSRMAAGTWLRWAFETTRKDGAIWGVKRT